MRDIYKVPSVHTFDITAPFKEFETLVNNWKNVLDFDSNLKDIPTPSKYPKYELLKNKDDSSHNRIRLCVAGMKHEFIEISTLKNKLLIKYDPDKTSSIKKVKDEKEQKNKKKDPEFESIVNYISDRSFTQYFSAPESYLLKVKSAEIKDGILTIDTIMELPKDMQETKIPITVIS